jgi:hypothetical protein
LDRATSGLGTPVGQFLLIEQDEGGHHLVTDHPTASAAWSFAGEDGFWRVAYLVDLDTGALIPPATPVSSSPEAPADLLAAVEAVRAAIEDTGANPSWHAYTMAIHRAEWPTLWAALDHLVEP